MRSLEVEPQKTEPGRICLLLTGELNAFTTDLLTTGIDRAVRDAGDSMAPVTATVTASVTAPVIVLDIGGVRFLDSAGIRGLLRRRADAEAAGRRLVLVNPTDWVWQILRATGLLATFGLAEPDGQSTGRTAHQLVQAAGPRGESGALRQAARASREPAAGRPVTSR